MTVVVTPSAAGMTEVESVANKEANLTKKQPEEFQREKYAAALKEVAEKSSLTPTAVTSLRKLVDLHLSQLKVEANYRTEWLALKAKYYKLLQDLHITRSGLLQSQTVSESASPDEAKAASQITDQSAAIPEFWLTVLLHNQAISSMIEPMDEEVLKYVTDISYTWANPDEQMDFTIVFKFAKNPYFTNTELTKTFNLEIDAETQDPILLRSIGTQIQWKEGKDITTKTVTKRQKNKRTGETRVVKEHVDKLSFFHFFDSHEVPDDEVLESMDDDQIDALESLLDTEYEVGCILRDKIINHAVGWYLGVEIDEDEETSEESDIDTDEEDELDEEEDEEGADEDVGGGTGGGRSLPNAAVDSSSSSLEDRK